MKIKFFLYLFFLSYSSSSYSTNIKVLDMQILINNSEILKLLYSEIENDQKNFVNKFQFEERELENKLSDINQLKLILNNEEIDKEINNYNDLLNNFTKRVKNFNLHYDNQITSLKNKIINEIIDILKEYSLQNQVDLILDSNHYILSSDSINITDLVLVKLNKVNIESKFEKYK